jgi:hypothetical protein
MRLFISLCGLLAATVQFLSFAQDLTILSASGDAYMKRGNAEQKLVAGMKLQPKDVVQLQEPCYCVISTGKNSLELRSAGSYSVAELSKRLQKPATDAATKLVGYLYNEMMRHSANIAASTNSLSGGVERAQTTDKTNTADKTVELSQTGGAPQQKQQQDEKPKTVGDALTDGLAGGIANIFSGAPVVKDVAKRTLSNAARGATITTLLPHNSVVADSTVNLYWSANRSGLHYTVRVSNSAGGTVFEQATDDSTLTLNLRKILAEQDQCYKWSVSAGADAASEEFCLSRPYTEKAKAVQDTVQLLRKELGGTALFHAVCGTLYARNNFKIQSFQSLREAARLAPTATDYQTALQRLLSDWGVSYQAVYERVLKNDYSSQK